MEIILQKLVRHSSWKQRRIAYIRHFFSESTIVGAVR